MDIKECPMNTNYVEKNGHVHSGLGSIFFEYMKKHKNKNFQFLADTAETETYEQVLKKCVRTALKLKEKGITRDDIISSCTHNHSNNVVPVIASLFLGIRTANLDPHLSHLDTIHLLKLIKPRLMFVAVEALPFMVKCLKEADVETELVVFGESKKYLNFSEFLDPNEDENKFQPVPIDDLKETAIVMFSSGTTGLPKGICLSHYGFIGQIFNNRYDWRSSKEHVSLIYTTFYWISAVMMLLRCVIDGGARIVCGKFDAINTWKLIEKYKVTIAFIAPYHARDIVAVRPINVNTSSLKYFLTGSAPVTTKLMEDLRDALPTTKVLQGYGQTEATGFILMFNGEDPKELQLQHKKPLSSGKIVSWASWKVVDPITEEVLKRNEKGELRYKTDYQMNGYYKIDSSSAYDSEGFLKSGDIVYYDEEDCFYVVDRIKEMFKYKGWHILPVLLERVLLTHPAVKEAVVIGIPHELDGDHPMAIVVLDKAYESTTPEEIERYVEKIVSENQRLRAGVKFVKKINRTVTGKIRRNVMRKMVLNGEI